MYHQTCFPTQNRTAADYENIIQHLSKENPEIADAMKKESN